MTNGPSGTLYIGVTADPAARIHQHRSGTGPAFCREHGPTRLVHLEPHPTIAEAIARERALKRWKRGWKLNLIGRQNPDWRNLWDDLNA
ncbi:GIY-YIG nuclease family protein [Sphingomonadaceae bacterium LXI357]|uniref:GIY-YIG nuclease family protein n=2 Tax=Stakelama marina TaxID=2826939 RepID=A0A8T4IHV5_9SPHN|nr:GIY-YIG nuclease family protein [Stakelama marina]